MFASFRSTGSPLAVPSAFSCCDGVWTDSVLVVAVCPPSLRLHWFLPVNRCSSAWLPFHHDSISQGCSLSACFLTQLYADDRSVGLLRKSGHFRCPVILFIQGNRPYHRVSVHQVHGQFCRAFSVLFICCRSIPS